MPYMEKEKENSGDDNQNPWILMREITVWWRSAQSRQYTDSSASQRPEMLRERTKKYMLQEKEHWKHKLRKMDLWYFQKQVQIAEPQD